MAVLMLEPAGRPRAFVTAARSVDRPGCPSLGRALPRWLAGLPLRWPATRPNRPTPWRCYRPGLSGLREVCQVRAAGQANPAERSDGVLCGGRRLPLLASTGSPVPAWVGPLEMSCEPCVSCDDESLSSAGCSLGRRSYRGGRVHRHLHGLSVREAVGSVTVAAT